MLLASLGSTEKRHKIWDESGLEFAIYLLAAYHCKRGLLERIIFIVIQFNNFQLRKFLCFQVSKNYKDKNEPFRISHYDAVYPELEFADTLEKWEVGKICFCEVSDLDNIHVLFSLFMQSVS